MTTADLIEKLIIFPYNTLVLVCVKDPPIDLDNSEEIIGVTSLERYDGGNGIVYLEIKGKNFGVDQ